MENFKNLIIEWNQKKNERQKLQHAYLFIALSGTLVAGLASLINPGLGHEIVKIAFYAVLVFLVNAIGWNLLQSGIINKLPSKPRKK